MKEPRRRNPTKILSHWRKAFDSLEYSPTEFYNTLEKQIDRHKKSGIIYGITPLKESGWFSPKRKYFRITYKELIYDICAAPFGDTFFISSWLGERPFGFFSNLLLLIPGINWYVMRRLERKTYWQYDTLMVFQDIVHNTLLEVVDEIASEKGLPKLSDSQRKPIMKNLLHDFPAENDIWTDKWKRTEKS